MGRLVQVITRKSASLGHRSIATTATYLARMEGEEDTGEEDTGWEGLPYLHDTRDLEDPEALAYLEDRLEDSWEEVHRGELDPRAAQSLEILLRRFLIDGRATLDEMLSNRYQ